MRFDDGFTDLSFHVVISGQTVHELHVGIAGSFHEFLVDLIWKKRSDTFVPNFFGLAHRDPNICMDEINAFDRGFRVIGNRDLSAGSLSEFTAHIDEFLRGPVFLRGTDTNIHTHLRTDEQKGVAGIEASVSDIGIGDVFPAFAAGFLHGEQIAEHLSWVPFICQAVKDRDTGVFCQLFNGFLLKAAELDAVIHRT